MDFRLSDEHQILKDTIARYLRDQYDLETRHRAAAIEPGFSPECWKAFAELGLIGALLPEEVGGFGGRGADIMVVMEELGRGAGGRALSQRPRCLAPAPSPRPAATRKRRCWSRSSPATSCWPSPMKSRIAATRSLPRRPGLAELGQPLPASRVGLAFLLMRLVFVQAVLLALPGRFKASSDARREELREAAKAAGRIANLSTYSGDQMRIFTGSLLSANLAERAGDANPYSLAVMGYSASYMGLTRLADRYFSRASAAAREHDDPIGLTEATQMECAYRLGNAELGRVRQLLDEGYAASERAGYRLGMAMSEGFVGQCEFLAGNFEGMLAHYLRAQELLTLRSPEHEHSFLCGEGLALCMLGRLDEARKLLTDGVEGVSAEYLLGDAFMLSSRAYAHAWAGDLDRAVEAAQATNAYVRGKGIAVPGPCGYVIAGPLEALLCAAEADRTHLPEAKTQATALDRWAAKHPVGEAGALLARARVAVLEKRPDTAADLFEQAASAAKRHALRFEQAQAELHLGHLRGPDTAPGRNHLEQARTLFKRCGAAHFAKRTKRALID